MGTNNRNQYHIHKGYNRLDIYTEPPPIQCNKRYQDNDIQQFNWHQPMQRSEYQQIKKQSSHQTPVHYQIPTGDIPPIIRARRQNGEYRTLNLQWRKSQNRDKTPLVNRENMSEGGNQLIPENVHTNPTNGSQSPFLGEGRETTVT